MSCPAVLTSHPEPSWADPKDPRVCENLQGLLAPKAPEPRQLCFEHSGHVAHRRGPTEAPGQQYGRTKRKMIRCNDKPDKQDDVPGACAVTGMVCRPDENLNLPRVQEAILCVFLKDMFLTKRHKSDFFAEC